MWLTNCSLSSVCFLATPLVRRFESNQFAGSDCVSVKRTQLLISSSDCWPDISTGRVQHRRAAAATDLRATFQHEQRDRLKIIYWFVEIVVIKVNLSYILVFWAFLNVSYFCNLHSNLLYWIICDLPVNVFALASCGLLFFCNMFHFFYLFCIFIFVFGSVLIFTLQLCEELEFPLCSYASSSPATTCCVLPSPGIRRSASPSFFCSV